MLLSYRDWVMQETVTLEQVLKYGLILTTALISFSCTELSEYDSQRVQEALNDSLLSTTESWDVTIKMMSDARTRMLIEGSHAVQYHSEENKRTVIEGPVYIQLFDSLGALETEAWSKRAIYHEAEREFELFDSVRVQTVTDRSLYSEYLKYMQESERISSPGFVTIITPKDSITGSGFNGETDLQPYTIYEISGQVTVD